MELARVPGLELELNPKPLPQPVLLELEPEPELVRRSSHRHRCAGACQGGPPLLPAAVAWVVAASAVVSASVVAAAWCGPSVPCHWKAEAEAAAASLWPFAEVAAASPCGAGAGLPPPASQMAPRRRALARDGRRRLRTCHITVGPTTTSGSGRDRPRCLLPSRRKRGVGSGIGLKPRRHRHRLGVRACQGKIRRHLHAALVWSTLGKRNGELLWDGGGG